LNSRRTAAYHALFNHRTLFYDRAVLGKDYEGQDCRIAKALEVVGERWTLLIVRDAFFGVRRFSDFLAHLDVPRAVLASRLRSLVDEGVLRQVPDPERSDRHGYELTEAGRGLWPVIHALGTWGESMSGERAPRRLYEHAPCGTRLDVAALCPACGERPDPGEVVTSLRRGARSGRSDHVSAALAKPHRLLDPIVAA
jgi:DNA-binding HxlR family transcriptional regulator